MLGLKAHCNGVLQENHTTFIRLLRVGIGTLGENVLSNLPIDRAPFGAAFYSAEANLLGAIRLVIW